MTPLADDLIDDLLDRPRFRATEHPEATCERCNRPNATWHAPSPLWNAVMRDEATGFDAYEIICPPCFAELAAAHGLDFIWHFGPHEDVSGLWSDRDGRVWDAAQCLWVEEGVATEGEPRRTP